MSRVLWTDISRGLSYLAAVVAILSAIVLGPSAYMFVNLVAIAAIGIPAAGLMYARFGTTSLKLRSLPQADRGYYIDQWQKTLWHVLGIITIISFIQILINISDPRNIGPPLGVMLLGLLYTLLFRVFILEPLREFKTLSGQSGVDPQPIRPKLSLIGKTVASTIVVQGLLLVAGLVLETHVLAPRRIAAYDQEQLHESKKWQLVTGQVNAGLGTDFTREEIVRLAAFVEESDFSDFKLIHRVYTSDKIDREKLFATLRKHNKETGDQ